MTTEDWLDEFMTAAAAKFPQKVRDALLQVSNKSRKLLALRGYLRTKRNIATDWAWSNEQASDFRKSAAGKELVTQVALVKDEFRKANPDYFLTNANLVRPLQRQIDLWNTNKSVGVKANELWSLALDKLRKAPLEQPTGVAAPKPSDKQVKAFEKFLRTTTIKKIMVATPGLSDHGHSNAVDFIIHDAKSKKSLAGTDSKDIAIWDGKGYTQMLNDAVKAAGGRFEGPLSDPYEPWHYSIRFATNSLEVPLVNPGSASASA